MSVGHQTKEKRYDFLEATLADLPFRFQDTTIGPSTLANGSLVMLDDAAGSIRMDLAGNGIPKDDLLFAEFVIKLNRVDENLDLRIGLANADNADPDVVGESAWFKILGTGATTHTVTVETDDGTTNSDDVATGAQVIPDQWLRLRINTSVGNQSISPPGSSTGPWGDVRFSFNRDSQGNAFAQELKPQQFMDMKAASGPFQPYISLRQITSAPSADVELLVREISLGYRVF